MVAPARMPPRRHTRRAVLLGGVAVLAGAAAGVAVGFATTDDTQSTPPTPRRSGERARRRAATRTRGRASGRLRLRDARAAIGTRSAGPGEDVPVRARDAARCRRAAGRGRRSPSGCGGGAVRARDLAAD